MKAFYDLYTKGIKIKVAGIEGVWEITSTKVYSVECTNVETGEELECVLYTDIEGLAK
jgi:hypothetical protein